MDHGESYLGLYVPLHALFAEEVLVLDAPVLIIFDVLLDVLYRIFLLVQLCGHVQAVHHLSVFGLICIVRGYLVI